MNRGSGLSFALLLCVSSFLPAQEADQPPDPRDALRAEMRELTVAMRELATRFGELEKRLEALEGKFRTLPRLGWGTDFMNRPKGHTSPQGYLRFPIEVERAMMGDAKRPMGGRSYRRDVWPQVQPRRAPEKLDDDRP